MALLDSGPTLSASGVFDLAVRISAEKLTADGPPDLPWSGDPSEKDLATAIAPALQSLPYAYRTTYVSAVQQVLASLAEMTAAEGGDDPAETILGAIYDHDPDSAVAEPLRRFLVVVDDLYDSFLARQKRQNLHLPMIEYLPPLATFRHSGALGPYTFPADTMKEIDGAAIGVVSIPSVYREHPLLWGSLAHEVGGHDVVHADTGLLAELKAGASKVMFALSTSVGAPALGPFLAALWQYWIDEATADVFAVLNMGPSFALNIAAWLMALRAELGQTTLPHLLTSSGAVAGNQLDTHPTDILRPYLAIGAIGALRALDAGAKAGYISLLDQVRDGAAGGATSISLDGYMPFTDSASFPVSVSLPMWLLGASASALGTYIVAAPFASLGGATIQDIETWDDVDETAARMIASRPYAAAADAIGDPALILAGGTLAAVANPSTYDNVNGVLYDALGLSADTDAIWGRPRVHFSVPESKEAMAYA